MKRPFLILAAIAGGAIIYSIVRTVKAGLQLDVKLRKFQLYQFVKDNMMVFRVTLRLLNPNNTTLHVQMIDIDAFLDPVFVEENGTLKVSNKGKSLGTCVDTKGFDIPANDLKDVELFVECRWIDLLAILTTSVIEILQNEENALNYFINKKVLLSGFIKAEGVQISFQNIIAVTE